MKRETWRYKTIETQESVGPYENPNFHNSNIFRLGDEETLAVEMNQDT